MREHANLGMSWHKLSNSESWLLLQNYCSYSERASPARSSPKEQAASCSLQFCEQASPIRRDKGVRTRSKLLDAVVHMANEQDYKNGVRKQLSFELCRGLQLRSVQGGAGRLPAPANAPKISNWVMLQGGVRAGCAQQRRHPRFAIGRLEGGAAGLPAAANAPKIA